MTETYGQPQPLRPDPPEWEIVGADRPIASAPDIAGAVLAAETVLKEGQASEVVLLPPDRYNVLLTATVTLSRDGHTVVAATDYFGRELRSQRRADEARREARS